MELDGRPLDLPASRRARALLALLAVERRVHSRSQLAGRFWPEVLEESARTSLRSALTALRKALGDDADRYLLAGREAVALADEDRVWVDLTQFEQLLAAGEIEQALELCRGELLEDLDDDWVYERRDEHRDRIASLLTQLASAAEERGDLQQAVALTRRRVMLDPLAEDPQRELIRRLAATGDRSAALTAYRRLQDRLRSELGLAPSARTRELAESLREGEVDRPADDAPPLTAASPARRPTATHPTGTVTLLFTDQVSSTDTLQRLGDDEAERLRRVHFRLLREVASAHGGEEVKNLGDGLMVAFTSAVDAVACAIAIQQAVQRHRERAESESLQVRVGLNVGEPIVDDDDYFGTPVVVAKRLCDAAASAQILASDVVRALVGTRGSFDFRPLDPIALKGIAEPVAACEVAWAPTTARRIPLPPAVVGVSTGLLVGRDRAQAELEQRWREALEGRRQVVLLAGEPGIGKTRLAAEFAREAHEQGAAVLAGRCYEQLLVPYQPFAEALRHYVAGCPPGELAVQLGPRRRELAVLVPDLEAPGGPVAAALADAQQERFRLFDAVASTLEQAALARPAILMLDDLHWADEGSLLLLRHVVRLTDSCPLMVLGTYRKTEVEPKGELVAALAELRRARALHELALEGLEEREVASLISAQSGRQAPARLTRQVAQRTEGNPFFIEELLRHLGASGTDELEGLDIPDSVKDLLLRRLDRLGEDCRRSLAVAAVVGRQFDLAVLEPVLDLSAEELVDQLEAAVHGQVVVEEPGAIGQYRFAHPLIRETIYGDVSATRRALLHRRVAEMLEAIYSDRLSENAGALAYHYSAAGDARKALEYHRQAALTAERAVAYETVFDHLNGAIAAGELVGLTAQTSAVVADLHRRRGWIGRFVDAEELADRDLELALEGAREASDRELEMHVLNTLGIRWHVLDSSRSISCHEQSLQIAEQLGDRAGQVAALNRLSLAYANELDLTRARELGERALELARDSGDEDAAMRAMDSLKFVALQLGDTAMLEDLVSQLERIQRERNEAWFLMWTLFEASFVPMARGGWEGAIDKLDEAVAISQRVGDAVAGGLMLHGRCWAARLRGDYGRALDDGRKSVVFAQRGGGVWHGWLAMTLAMVLRDLGAIAEAREILEVGFAAAERIDARLQILSCAPDLAWLRWLTGDEAGALALLGRAESLLDEVRTPPGMAYLYTVGTYTSAARTALAAGQLDRAEGWLRYLGAPTPPAIRYGVAERDYLLARCAQVRGDIDGAEKLLEEALKEAGTKGLLALRREIHGEIARVALAQGRPEDGAHHAREAQELIDRMADSIEDAAMADQFRAGADADIESVALAAGRRAQ